MDVRWLDDTEPIIRAALARIAHNRNQEKFDGRPPSPPGTALDLPELRLIRGGRIGAC